MQSCEKQFDNSEPEAASREQVKLRVLSLDVYRGLIMVSLMFAGFGLAGTAHRHLRHANETPVDAARQETTHQDQISVLDNWWWRTIGYQFSHAEWVGCTYWDLVQPSFMFMVGTSMAFSYVKRKKLGSSHSAMFGHAVWRSIVLILLGVFLASNWSNSTEWTFMNVLTQIGLGYTFLFLLWGRSFRIQAIVAFAILVGTWLIYVAYPHSGLNLETGAPEVGVSAEWAQEHLENIRAPWQKNVNAGSVIDTWFLNLFPRTKPFVYSSGGYQTINFLPSISMMIFGLMAGELFRSSHTPSERIKILILAGLGGLVLGQILNWTGVCPLVKRICTPSFILFSSGWCSIILGALYGIVDVLQLRFWIFPFVVVGMNSIAAYCIHMLMGSWITKSLKTHLGSDLFQLKLTVGDHSLHLANEALTPTIALYEPFIQAMMVGLVMWTMCWWMYRQKIFVRI